MKWKDAGIGAKFFRTASALSMLVCAATVVLWERSYRATIIVPLKGAPGWRFVAERGEVWGDDEPLWYDVEKLSSRQIREFVRFAEGQRRLLEEGRMRAEFEANASRIPREYVRAYEKAEEANLLHLMRVQTALFKGRPSWSSVTYHRVPRLWKVATASAVLPSVWLFVWGLGPRKPAGCCARCSYDLTGNTSGICPECGVPVVLKDPLAA